MKYGRVYNFSAGPAIMPEPVLEEIRDEMMNYRGSGMCVMEMSHRSKVFQQIIDEAEADLRKLMGIPDNYKVLFMQGGATLQFSAIPMNLCKNGVFDYIVTGSWSKKAAQEAAPEMEALKQDAAGTIILDCTELSYISSSGLRLFLVLRKETAEQGGKVILQNISDNLRNVFMMTGFLNLFEIQES